MGSYKLAQVEEVEKVEKLTSNLHEAKSWCGHLVEKVKKLRKAEKMAEKFQKFHKLYSLFYFFIYVQFPDVDTDYYYYSYIIDMALFTLSLLTFIWFAYKPTCLCQDTTVLKFVILSVSSPKSSCTPPFH